MAPKPRRVWPPALTPRALRRFLSLLREDPETGCMLYEGQRSRSGHGRFVFRGVMYFAHRLAFALGGGVLTAEKPQVLHNCPGEDRPNCCTFSHLRAGTNDENQRDKAAKGQGRQSKTGLPYGVILGKYGRYESQAKLGGKQEYFGTFDTWQEASAIAFLHKNLHLYPDLGVN